jgi:prepilin-type N-terminal cleavage/methylation domain-containing protein
MIPGQQRLKRAALISMRLRASPNPRTAGQLLMIMGGLGILAGERKRRSNVTPRSHLSPSPWMLGEGKASAFTLIELMACLMILSVLITCLLAALNRVRARGDGVQCMGNLRELAMANLTYTADHDGQYVPAQEPTNKVRWHGVRRGVNEAFDPTRGPLAPI